MNIQPKKQPKKQAQRGLRTTVEIDPEMLKTLQSLCKQYDFKMKSLVDNFLQSGHNEFLRGLKNDSN